MAEVRMTMDEYLALLNGLSSDLPAAAAADATETKPKRKMTAYQRRYKANFRKIAPDYQKQDGSWKKGGFKRAVKEAHRMSKK